MPTVEEDEVGNEKAEEERIKELALSSKEVKENEENLVIIPLAYFHLQ